MTLLSRMLAEKAEREAEKRDRDEARKAVNFAVLCTPSKAIGRGVYTGSTAGAAPKTEPKRNRALLDMAQGRPCLLCVTHEPMLSGYTTVSCHSNLSVHGKAGARKADDQYSVWGCAACHEWLDRGPAPAAQKEAVFMSAHTTQVMEWRYMATAMHEPARFRKAAQWALDQLAAAREQQGAKA